MNKKIDIYFLIGLFGVIAFRQLPSYWHILAIIPILIGFSIHYGDNAR